METANNYYLIQEFCDGGDFRGLLKNKKSLPENEALLVLKDLL
jgi:serine/threonine protein kinase